jgi:xanthine dehydrogenase accessory factor
LSEIAAVCRAWFSTSRAGEPAWLATVTDVEGSSYRRPGARLIFTREALLAGSISGGCLEREVARTGPWLARRGPVVKVFDSRLDDDEIRQGTGCEGRVHVLVEPLSPTADGALSVIFRELGAERAVAVATVVQTPWPLVPLGARVVKTTRGLVSHVPDPALSRVLAEATEDALFEGSPRRQHLVHDGVVALIEVLAPPPHLFVFGAGADTVPVVRFAAQLGWTVTVCGATTVGARARFVELARVSSQSLSDNIAELERSARPLAVVMSHDYQGDRDTLAELLRTQCAYVGVLGPARRTERLLGEIERASGAIPPERKSAIFGPAGLALGAETADEIALSIVAEAQSVLASSSAGFLRERSGHLHVRPLDGEERVSA